LPDADSVVLANEVLSTLNDASTAAVQTTIMNSAANVGGVITSYNDRSSTDEPVVLQPSSKETVSVITDATVKDSVTKSVVLKSPKRSVNKSQETGVKHKVLKSTKTGEPAQLLPKPNAFLLPVLVPVVVLTDPSQTSAVKKMPQTIAPKRPESRSQLTQSHQPSLNACAATPTDVQRERAPSVRTQSTQAVGGLRRKAAETQTLPSTGLHNDATGFSMKESTASQVNYQHQHLSSVYF
jgi:hypothetical protein